MEDFLNRLDIVVLRQRDLTLFRDLAPPGDRASLDRVESADRAFSQFAARLREFRDQSAAKQGSGESGTSANLERLKAIARHLAVLESGR